MNSSLRTTPDETPVSLPLVVDIERNALDDGPGIRSVVFFKGCSLRCQWCQNPETLSPRAEVQRRITRCTGCERCRIVCPNQVARPAAQPEDRQRCRSCGRCVEACLAGARRLAGQPYPVETLAEQLLRDEPFYRRSGGGVTFSGGEPALHPAYAGALAAALRARGIHVLLETAGHFEWAPFALRLLPHLDAVYYDTKLADPEQHRRFTGASNERIFENLRRLRESFKGTILPRIPLVPGITDTAENLRGLGRRISALGFSRAALLPYNPLWIEKRIGLSLDLPYRHESFLEPSHIERCRRHLESAGIQPIVP